MSELETGPRIVRGGNVVTPLVLSAVLGVAAAVTGYTFGRRVFVPAHEDETVGQALPVDVGERDAGSVLVAPAATPLPLPAPVAPQHAPAVPVHVARSTIQSCGDGDELTTPGAQCAPVPGLEPALREVLQKLGDCEPARDAGRTPNAVLSLGVRLDFPRRRATTIAGRSSSLRTPLPLVACARTVLADAPTLWPASAPPHARYLYFFTLSFGPIDPANDRVPPSASAPVTAAGTPSAAVVASPLAHSEAATVVWATAVLRDAPRTGAIVARVPAGTALTVTGRSGSWWQVQRGSVTAWVFGEAIGR